MRRFPGVSPFLLFFLDCTVVLPPVFALHSLGAKDGGLWRCKTFRVCDAFDSFNHGMAMGCVRFGAG